MLFNAIGLKESAVETGDWGGRMNSQPYNIESLLVHRALVD